MKLFNCFLLLICIIVFCSCSQKEEAASKLREQLMHQHDEEMAKMDALYYLQKTLKAVADTVTRAEEKQKIQKYVITLHAADQSMMDWMRKYEEPQKTADPDEKSQYYSRELEKVKAIKILMELSIDSANTYLKDHDIKTN